MVRVVKLSGLSVAETGAEVYGWSLGGGELTEEERVVKKRWKRRQRNRLKPGTGRLKKGQRLL